VALLGVDIPVQDGEARQLLGTRIVAVPYAPSGTSLLVRALRKKLRKDANAYLLRNHGFICCARTLAEAIVMAEEVEREAHRYLRRAVERASGPQVAQELLEELR
jgi:L-fuculose-phosphate aldolase